MDLPDFVTHYTRGVPYRSITASGADRWPEIVAGFSDDTAWGRGRFADPDYLPRRVRVEAGLRDAFIALGGSPVLAHPIDCALGRHPPGRNSASGGPCHESGGEGTAGTCWREATPMISDCGILSAWRSNTCPLHCDRHGDEAELRWRRASAACRLRVHPA